MALTISPSIVEKDGGYKITLTGLVLADGDYFFHVGPLGTYEDPRAYAGAYGNGDTVSVVGGSGSFVTPPLSIGGLKQVSAYDVATPTVSGSVISASGLVYQDENYRSATYSYRNLFSQWLNTGPRAITEEEPR
ncbi:MAG: hypothetical protein CME17_06880 [Gemmatimonadetes bacterium]|nr:hypothetical protein [Gemmatimonadota bacterium]|tara:strand:+ start:8285 stop:8686 length:402 start_codon:yes stop_codon:yes gene_type:complete